MMKNGFHSSDAWVLLTLGSFGKHPAAIKDVILRGDQLNHAIFNREELRGGLTRFLRTGYVSERDGKFIIAGEAAEFFASMGKIPMQEAWDRCGQFLDVDWRSEEEMSEIDESSDNPSLSDEALDDGYRDWKLESDDLFTQAMSFASKKIGDPL
jgi:hypothetical protein